MIEEIKILVALSEEKLSNNVFEEEIYTNKKLEEILSDKIIN